MYQSFFDIELSLFQKIAVFILIIMALVELVAPGLIQTVLDWLVQHA